MIGRMRTLVVVLTLCTVLFTVAPVPTQGQEPAPPRRTGAVVPGFGGVFEVPSPGLLPPKGQDLPLRFDVRVGAEPGEPNTSFDTLARFQNMDAQAGVPREQVKAALVVHGTAGKDTLTREEYRKRYGKGNPNLALLGELKAAGCRARSAVPARDRPRSRAACSGADARGHRRACGHWPGNLAGM
jgi:hypothetical protein